MNKYAKRQPYLSKLSLTRYTLRTQPRPEDQEAKTQKDDTWICQVNLYQNLEIVNGAQFEFRYLISFEI